MITKPARALTLLGLVAYCFSIIVPLLAIVLSFGSSTAYASGEQYVFYYNPSNVAAIQQGFSNNPLSPSPVNNFVDTSVYGKGGVFGKTPVGFAYDQGANANLPAPTNGVATPVYTSTTAYSCSPKVGSGKYNNFVSASIVLTMTLHLTPADIFSGSNTGHDIVTGTLSVNEGQTQITYQKANPGNRFSKGSLTNATDSLSNIEQNNGSTNVADFLPPGCVPAGLNLSKNSGGARLANYQAMIPSAQKAWPGLQDSNALLATADAANNPPSDPGTSKPLGCIDQPSDPLTWIICPVVDELTKIINSVDGLITDQLNIKTSAIFCDGGDTCKAYYTAWQSFRDISLGLMAIAGLVVVISQALGLEILDAYTIRKILPRLLIAAVAITLSWPLMRFLIQLSDDLGFGIRHLIYLPFSKLPATIDLSFGGGAANQFFGGAAAAGGVVVGIAAWIVFGGIGALLAYAATAALAVFVAILVLILRQIAVILLVLLSPIALIAYVLPNTQRVYRLWWESFSKALLMFPLIAAFIATGRVFSAIAVHNGGIINQFIGFVAYFAPYFMIPLTFKLAGGTVSALGNFVNSRAQGGFTALGEKRKRSRAERVKAAQTGGLYRNDLGRFKLRPGGKQRSMGGLLNAVGNATVDIGDSGTQKLGNTLLGKPFFGRKARILENKIAEAKLQHSRKGAEMLNAHYQTGRAMAGQHHYFIDELMKGDDASKKKGVALQQALVEGKFGSVDKDGNYTGRAIKGEKDAVALADILQNGGQGATQASAELRAKSAMIGSFKGAGNEETQRADLETIGLMAAAQAGRLDDHEISASRQQYITSHGGDSGGYATTRESFLRDIATPKRVEQARGHGNEYTLEDGQLVSRSVYEDPTSDAAQKSWGRISAQELGSGKSEAVAALRNTILAAASEREYDWDKDTKELVPKMVTDPNTGRKVHKMKEGEKLIEAKQAQSRLRYIGGYAVGDTGVGREIQSIADKLDMGSLSFGESRERLPGDKVNPGAAAPPTAGGGIGGPGGIGGSPPIPPSRI